MLESLRLVETPLSMGAAAVYPHSKRLESRFTFIDNFDELFTLWEKCPGDRIKIPRGLCPVPVDDRRIPGPKIKVNLNFKPRNDEQTRVVSEAYQLLASGANFIIQAKTGFGKTVVCAPLIAAIGRKTLVIVPKSDLMKQWREEMAKFLPGVRVGTIQQNKYDVAHKDVVLASLKSIAKKGKYPPSMIKEFGFVIWDEVHRIPAETFSPTAMMFPAKLRLGLSATPERMDGRDILIRANIGDVAVETSLRTMRPKVAVYRSPWLKPKWLKVIPGKLGKVLIRLAKCHPRNQLLLKIITAGYKKGRRTVVFADSIEHLERLRGLAVRAGVPFDDTALYISAATVKEKKKAPTKRLIFTTYGMMAEGTNIPWLDLGIMATPRASVTQPLGRILREWEGKPQPVWVDIVDDSSGVLIGYAKKRQRQYREEEANVVTYGW